MFRSRFLMAAFVAAIAALAGPATSQAAFTISASDGLGNSATIGDNNVGNTSVGTVSGVSDTNPALSGITTPQILSTPGPVVGQFTVGNFQIGVNVTSTSDASQSSFSTNTSTVIRNTGSSAATLTLTTSNVFILPLNVNMQLTETLAVNVFRDKFGHVIGGLSTSDSVSALATANPTFATTPTFTLSQNGNANNLLSPVAFTRTSLFFTVTQQFTILLQAGQSAEFNGSAFVSSIPGDNLLITPAPAGLILAATGLPFLGLLRRRMRRTETTVAA